MRGLKDFEQQKKMWNQNLRPNKLTQQMLNEMLMVEKCCPQNESSNMIKTFDSPGLDRGI